MTVNGKPFTTTWGETGAWYRGTDDRGIALEVGTVQRGPHEMVIHAMPTEHRHNHGK
jgi:hypothetical protein